MLFEEMEKGNVDLMLIFRVLGVFVDDIDFFELLSEEEMVEWYERMMLDCCRCDDGVGEFVL